MAAEPRGLQRRSYLDLLRGIAVLLMIDAHLFDSWTRFPDRETAAFDWAMLLGGMGTTLFLTLAGVAVALSAGSKLRRTGSPAAASAAVARRGLEIFAARLRVPASGLDSGLVSLVVGPAQGRRPQHHGAVDCPGRLPVASGPHRRSAHVDLRRRHRGCGIRHAARSNAAAGFAARSPSRPTSSPSRA